MKRNCDHCGVEYEAKRPNSRYHDATCRKRASRAPQRAVDELHSIRAAMDERFDLLVTTEIELERAGRRDTVLGRQALVLARRISAPMETGAAIASLSKEFRAVMEAALDGVTAEVNPLDELRARRDRKRAAG